MTKSKKQFAAQQQSQDQGQGQGQPKSQTQTKSQTQAKSQSQTKSQTKSKSQGSGDEFGRTVELTFGDHPWPASRSELLEYASQQGAFAKSDLARLKRIPHRDYHSVADLMDATRMADTPAMQGAGPVATAEHNRRAMGDAMPDSAMQSAPMYDEQSH